MTHPASRLALATAFALMPTSAFAEAPWDVADGVARASQIEASDGQPAALEVRCRPEPEVRLTHPVLAWLSEEAEDRREGWLGVVRVRGGWGLDLDRPDHQGAQTYWWRCPGRDDCLVARDPAWMFRMLRSQFTWHLRASPPDGAAVDIRVSLAGSGKALDAVCAGISALPETPRRFDPADEAVAERGPASTVRVKSAPACWLPTADALRTACTLPRPERRGLVEDSIPMSRTPESRDSREIYRPARSL